MKVILSLVQILEPVKQKLICESKSNFNIYIKKKHYI